jgi:hypothetical protein
MDLFEQKPDLLANQPGNSGKVWQHCLQAREQAHGERLLVVLRHYLRLEVRLHLKIDFVVILL